jgi:hypothetical protein
MANTTKTPNVIVPQLGFSGRSDADLLKRLNAVHDGLLNNPAYPSPPVDMPGFKAAIDAYTAAVSAMLDGGKSVTIERNKRRADVIIMLRLLGHFVEAACKNEMITFVSSGFVPAKPGVRSPSQPVTDPRIVSVDQGSPGQLVVTIKPVTMARSYELRYATVAAAGAVNWTTITVPSTKPPIPVNNLTPGGTYTFQVRAFGKLGFSDWSASVERMCI